MVVIAVTLPAQTTIFLPQFRNHMRVHSTGMCTRPLFKTWHKYLIQLADGLISTKTFRLCFTDEDICEGINSYK